MLSDVENGAAKLVYTLIIEELMKMKVSPIQVNTMVMLVKEKNVAFLSILHIMWTSNFINRNAIFKHKKHFCLWIIITSSRMTKDIIEKFNICLLIKNMYMDKHHLWPAQALDYSAPNWGHLDNLPTLNIIPLGWQSSFEQWSTSNASPFTPFCHSLSFAHDSLGNTRGL